jgi:hypothetical protein
MADAVAEEKAKDFVPPFRAIDDGFVLLLLLELFLAYAFLN